MKMWVRQSPWERAGVRGSSASIDPYRHENFCVGLITPAPFRILTGYPYALALAGNPEGIAIIQPRVARNELPGGTPTQSAQS
jgi:hypothetical protein